MRLEHAKTRAHRREHLSPCLSAFRSMGATTQFFSSHTLEHKLFADFPDHLIDIGLSSTSAALLEATGCLPARHWRQECRRSAASEEAPIRSTPPTGDVPLQLG